VQLKLNIWLWQAAVVAVWAETLEPQVVVQVDYALLQVFQSLRVQLIQ
jgi:hypothetical protein